MSAFSRVIVVPDAVRTNATKSDFWSWLVARLSTLEIPSKALARRIARELETIAALPADLEVRVTVAGVGEVAMKATDIGLIYGIILTARTVAEPAERVYLETVRGWLDADGLTEDAADEGSSLLPVYGARAVDPTSAIGVAESGPVTAMPRGSTSGSGTSAQTAH